MGVLKDSTQEKVAQELALLDARDSGKNRSRNQHAACVAAGHDCSPPNARKYCQRHKIWDRVAEIQGKAVAIAADVARVEISIARIDAEIANIAFFPLHECLERDDSGKLRVVDGHPVLDYHAMKPQHWAAVSEIDGEKGRVKFHDKVGLLRDLRRHALGQPMEGEYDRMTDQQLVAELARQANELGVHVTLSYDFGAQGVARE